jgi:hypothetical protein
MHCRVQGMSTVKARGVTLMSTIFKRPAIRTLFHTRHINMEIYHTREKFYSLSISFQLFKKIRSLKCKLRVFEYCRKQFLYFLVGSIKVLNFSFGSHLDYLILYYHTIIVNIHSNAQAFPYLKIIFRPTPKIIFYC